MIKFLLVLILFITASSYPQVSDSLLNAKDTSAVIKQDTILVTDTTKVYDSTAVIKPIKADTLHPINQRTSYTGSSFIGKKVLKNLYSAYEGYSLQESENIFIRDYAFLGYPDEIFYYGTNSVNLLEDGLSVNTMFGYVNSNHIALESVDSIEFIPAVRGFLYGQSFSQTSINFVTYDFVSQSPYTRVRYYEGLEREGLVSGTVNFLLFNKMNLYADITNRSSDPRYFNTDLSSWQGKVKAKYFFSDKYNLLASYNFNHFFSGFNGGVDIDSIASATSSIGSVLYDEILAPVVYRTRQLEDKQHLFRLRFLALPARGFFTDFNLYYSFSHLRLFANEDFTASDFAYKSKSFGAYIDQRYTRGPLTLELRGDYNHSNLLINLYEPENPISNKDYNALSLSAAGYLSILDSLVIPSVFYRYGNTKITETDNQHGAGADIFIRPLNFLTFYTGYSFFDNLFSDQTGTTFQAGASGQFGLFKLKGEYYTRNNFRRALYFGGSENIYGLLNNYPVEVNHSGIDASAELRVWGFFLSSTINYPFLSDSKEVTGLPELISRTGFYFWDYLFSGSLDLKTGFTFTYWGEQFLSNEHSRTDYSPYYVPEAYRIDFTFSGEIEKAAILFFTWENITDNQFYITPFYPMPFSGFKFGVSWELFN